MAEGVGNAPTSAMPILFSRQVQPAYICLPSVMKSGCQGWTRTNTERLNRPPCYFDTTWQFEIGAASRTPTCIVPLRRRMPDLFDHGSNLRMVGTAGFPPRPPGPKPGALKTELRSDKMADPKGFAPSAFPQTTGCSAN